MAILKCKMCGEVLHVEEGSTVCECEFCGTKQAVPVADDDKKMALYERANKLRFACEFDKAASVYESIIAEFPDEAESYWGIILCKYGIEYVNDPLDGRKVPTCHRSSFDSVMEDPDFEMIMENADSASRKIYREQAKEIEEIRKGIIEVSGQEAPYDIFICYKETDENGDRTVDSVIAQNVYEELTKKGYRVFFARITLEDKLGTEYEPYIFAALNSAKIMLAFGTSYDYYNAVFVKNEWSRYIKLMAKDKNKHLIPCYKDIDAYDMPKDFKNLQAQDMGKVGAEQDLFRGIDKIMGKDKEKEKAESAAAAQAQQSSGPNVDSLLDRGYMALEDEEWDEASSCFDQALNMNAKCSRAWFGKFMAGQKCPTQDKIHDEFVNGEEDLSLNRYFKRAKQYSDEEIAARFNKWEEERNSKIEVIKAAEEEEIVKEVAKAAEKPDFETMRKTAKDEIDKLKRQLTSGVFDMTEEEKAESERLASDASAAEIAANRAENTLEGLPAKLEIERLKSEISIKQGQILTLGSFKGREKKELQTQIDLLSKSLEASELQVKPKAEEAAGLRNMAVIAKQKADNYIKKVNVNKRIECEDKVFKYSLLGAEAGDYVTLGKYLQGSKGLKPLEWKVLECNENEIFLLCKYALLKKSFNSEKTDITWEECSLRSWLNAKFLDSAFSSQEKDIMISKKVEHVNTETAETSEDDEKIFLMSINEADKYFPTEDLAKTTLPDDTSVWWWLRSHGDSLRDAAVVSRDGVVSEGGNDVNNEEGAVRPALKIDTSKLY